MKTDQKSLSSMPLTGLILTDKSLENIIENGELDEKLNNYATKEYAETVASDALTGYVPLTDYNALQDRLAALEKSVAEMSAQTFDGDREDSVSSLLEGITGSIDTLTGQLNGFSLESVSESAFNPSQANDKTFYFVTPDRDGTETESGTDSEAGGSNVPTEDTPSDEQG